MATASRPRTSTFSIVAAVRSMAVITALAIVPLSAAAPASAITPGDSLLPVVQTLPTIVGAAITGQTLTGSPGSWNNSPSRYAYQWKRCDALGANCATIPGATTNSYRLTHDDSTTNRSDAGYTVRLTVSATNSAGTKRATTAATSMIIGQQAYVKASNAGIDDTFADAVAISGDTMVVGSVGEDSSTSGVNSTPNEASSFSGAAYVFTRDRAGVWTQQAYLKASNPEGNDFFGASVAISGDTIVVGAYGKSAATGAAYVFTRTGTTWTQQATFTGDDSDGSDYFGRSVAVSGDTVVVGADTKNDVTGAAYVFTRTGTSWTQQAALVGSDSDAGDKFGFAVAISGDIIAVGAFGKTSDKGGAYVFTRTGTSWAQEAILVGANNGGMDLFGIAVGVSGDTVAVGASGTDARKGAVYLFTRSGTSWTKQSTLFNKNAAAIDNFGSSVAMSGDTIAVGAFGRTNYTGSVSVFARAGTEWAQQSEFAASNAGAGDYFGDAIALDGNTVVAGAPREFSSSAGVNSTPDEAAGYSGAAYSFIVQIAPTNSAIPAITGPQATPAAGQRLRASTGTWAHGPLGFDYQWLRCGTTGSNCANIVGARAATYSVTVADAGYTLRVRVTASNALASTTATSEPTATATAPSSAPTNSVVASISDSTPSLGQTLTGTTGTWADALSYSYRWYRCVGATGTCTAISSATTSQYAVVAGDAGFTLMLRVTGHNAWGSLSVSSTRTSRVV